MVGLNFGLRTRTRTGEAFLGMTLGFIAVPFLPRTARRRAHVQYTTPLVVAVEVFTPPGL